VSVGADPGSPANRWRKLVLRSCFRQLTVVTSWKEAHSDLILSVHVELATAVSNLLMRVQWRLVLPALGLALFAAISYHAVRWNRTFHGGSSRYFWWASIRLDTDPLERHPRVQPITPCTSGSEDCVSWDPEYISIESGVLPHALVLSALPAFAVGSVVMLGLGCVGVSQFSTFMVSMPVFILSWYYFLGWLLDRWIFKRGLPATSIDKY